MLFSTASISKSQSCVTFLQLYALYSIMEHPNCTKLHQDNLEYIIYHEAIFCFDIF